MKPVLGCLEERVNKINPSRDISTLRSLYSAGRLIPFIGAGMSRPLGLPDWQDLTRIIAEELGYDGATLLGQGTFPQLVEYCLLTTGSIEPIRQILLCVLDPAAAVQRRKESAAFAALVASRYPRIYTSNVDRHIESAFADAGTSATVIRNISDLQRPSLGTEVVKFHGTLEDPTSLVLTESAFMRRMRLEDPLDLLLRADSMRAAFLFIGYSFSDSNIRFLWNVLAEMRKRLVGRGEHEFNSTLLGLGINPVQLALLANWGINVIELDQARPEHDLASILSAIAA